jgi:hypothetical protein
MDFMNRGGRPVQQNTHTDATVEAKAAGAGAKSKFKNSSKLMRVAQVGLLGAIAVLILAALLGVVFSKDVSSREEGIVKKDQFQAVFLNGGQVYFGKIGDLNSKFLSMSNIYYLRVNQQVQPNQANTNSANDISLVKLGCELHGPEDTMVINREQVVFWENLKADGQVAKAVDEYVKANPDGQKCDQQQNTSSTDASTNNATNATTPAANTQTQTTTPAPATNNNQRR